MDLSTPPGLEVRASGIHGLGVFATRRLARDTVLGVYAGEHMTGAQYDARYPHGKARFVLQIANDTYVDAASLETSNWTRYLNSPHGIAGARANVAFVAGGRVRTLRAIAPGAELLVSYGRVYSFS